MKVSKFLSLIVLLLFGICCFYIICVTIDQRDATVATVSHLSKRNGDSDSSVIGENDARLFWFLQITDLHISKFKNHDIVPQLKRFLQHHLPVFSPDFILISGDLTDAKTIDGQGSEQYIEEWKSYQQLIDESKILQKVKVFDLRGNHDAFDVPNLLHQKNYYRSYSVQGKQHRQSYMYTHRKPYGTYSIIAMDACPNPGPKRPYNFFGVVSSGTIQLIQHYSHLARGSNLTLWFGHYPTSTIVAPGYDLRSIIGRTATAYFCGHLHTLGGTTPAMYSLQPQGYLELELGDWKENRLFRLVAIDHDLMSFTDRKMDEWPVILITNPKDSSFLMPHKEPAYRIARSTHIRILAFSVSAIKSVKVYLDGKFHGNAKHVDPQRPLFTIAWDPKKYLIGAQHDQHEIQVTVEDKTGRIRTVKQTFSVFETPSWKFRYGPGIILSSDITHLVRIAYYSIWISLFSPVLIMRFIRYRSSVRRIIVNTDDWLLMIYHFSQNDYLFYPWILYFLYSACGPLMIGSIISGGLNFVFVHGLYVNGVYVPEAFPYISESLQNVLFLFPLMIYFCRRISKPVCQGGSFFPNRLLTDMRTHWGIYIIMFLYLSWSFFSAYMPYGIIALIVSPCRLGLLCFIWFMHRSTLSRSQEHRNTHTSSDDCQMTS